MKLFLEIITNPFGIAINVVHWAIVMFAFYKEGNPFEKKIALCFHCEHFITDWLFRINAIPLIIIQIIGDSFQTVFGKNDLIDTHLIFLFLFLIIAQWFLIGFLLNIIIDKFKLDKIQTLFK